MARMTIKFKPTNLLQKRLEALKDDKELRYKINNKIAELCDPYVPYDLGGLSSDITVTDKGVRYTQPYARYQYYGKVYGPNIPWRDEFGNITGFSSLAGEKKHPTGATMNYNTTTHPLATSYWDKAMLRDKSDTLNRAVGQYIRKAMK